MFFLCFDFVFGVSVRWLVVICSCATHVFICELHAVAVESPGELILGSECHFAVKDGADSCSTVVL